VVYLAPPSPLNKQKTRLCLVQEILSVIHFKELGEFAQLGKLFHIISRKLGKLITIFKPKLIIIFPFI